MTVMEQDLDIILKKIEFEINQIDEAYKLIDQSVEKDLEDLINKYNQKVQESDLPSELTIDKIRNQYKASLVSKKREAMDRAKERLMKLKEEIEFTIGRTKRNTNLNMGATC